MNKFVFIFMLASTTGFTQSSNPKVLKIDTVMIFKNIKFSSDLKGKIAICLDEDNYETDSFTIKDAKNTISLFNKELDTSVFYSIKAITGVSIKTELSENWMTIMEWHFQDEKVSKKVLIKTIRDFFFYIRRKFNAFQ